MTKDIDRLKRKVSLCPSFSTIHLIEYIKSPKFVADMQGGDSGVKKIISNQIKWINSCGHDVGILDPDEYLRAWIGVEN